VNLNYVVKGWQIEDFLLLESLVRERRKNCIGYHRIPLCWLCHIFKKFIQANRKPVVHFQVWYNTGHSITLAYGRRIVACMEPSLWWFLISVLELLKLQHRIVVSWHLWILCNWCGPWSQCEISSTYFQWQLHFCLELLAVMHCRYSVERVQSCGL
jgi:hypothetical protein